MRYYPSVLENIADKAYFSQTTYMNPDPLTLSHDLFFINGWLEKNFYNAYGDPIELHFTEKADFCLVLLGEYYATPGVKEKENVWNHYDMLACWLEERTDCETTEGESDCLLNILEGCF